MQWRDSSSRIVCAAGGARSIGTLVLILTLCIASTLWAKPPRRSEPQRVEAQAVLQQETEAEMPNTLYWNSVTKEWNAASFGGTLPVWGDSVYADGRSQAPMMLSIDRSTQVYTTELVVNGTFATDTVWTKGTGWTIAGGLGVAAAGSASDLSQAGILIVGRAYKITFTVSGRTAGSIQAKAGSGNSPSGETTNATFVLYQQCLGSTALIFTKDSSFDGDIDNVSVVESPGLHLAVMDFGENYEGDVGQVGVPLKLSADDFIWRGRGKLYYQPSGGAIGNAVARLTIDTPNIAHEIAIGPTFDGSNVTEFRVLRGRMRFSSLLVHQRAYIGARSNEWRDAYVTVDDGVPIRQIYQRGGTHIYKGGQPGDVGDEFVMSGGYCQFDGTAKRYIQTGGHVDFGLERLTGSSPLLTEAWLLGGSMNATKAALSQSITTLYIDVDNFELTEDSKLTVGTRIKLGGP